MHKEEKVILTNMCMIYSKDNILVQDRIKSWKGIAFPGGHVENHESIVDSVIREIKEETNLDIKEENLELIAIVSGNSRRNEYPNGDVVINNTALYCVRNYSGNLKWDSESKSMKFFDLDNLPTNQNDPDLIEIYKKYLKGKTL